MYGHLHLVAPPQGPRHRQPQEEEFADEQRNPLVPERPFQGGKRGFVLRIHFLGKQVQVQIVPSFLQDLCGIGELSEQFRVFAFFQIDITDADVERIPGLLILHRLKDSGNQREECVKDNVGKKKISSYGDKRENTYYLECTENGWRFIDESGYYCDGKNAAGGDVCSFSVYGDSIHYIYYPVYSDAEDSVTIYGWEKCNYDSVLGCCPNGMNFQGYNPEIGFREVGGKSYYCNAGEWISTTIVPHQYTDSRKEGLTNMEYDILDLPKEASVGDRAGGLLESCSYGVVLNEEDGPKQGTFNYCVPQTYYRYRGDGSWTKETEGLKNIVHMDGDGPDRILQCDSGKIELVDYVLGRYEEK